MGNPLRLDDLLSREPTDTGPPALRLDDLIGPEPAAAAPAPAGEGPLSTIGRVAKGVGKAAFIDFPVGVAQFLSTPFRAAFAPPTPEELRNPLVRGGAMNRAGLTPGQLDTELHRAIVRRAQGAPEPGEIAGGAARGLVTSGYDLERAALPGPTAGNLLADALTGGRSTDEIIEQERNAIIQGEQPEAKARALTNLAIFGALNAAGAGVERTAAARTAPLPLDDLLAREPGAPSVAPKVRSGEANRPTEAPEAPQPPIAQPGAAQARGAPPAAGLTADQVRDLQLEAADLTHRPQEEFTPEVRARLATINGQIRAYYEANPLPEKPPEPTAPPAAPPEVPAAERVPLEPPRPLPVLPGREAPVASETARALAQLRETGFAGEKPPAAVEVPPGQSIMGEGSTTAVMKRAQQIVGPEEFRRRVQQNIAARGGATDPTVEMAATEETARRIVAAPAPPAETLPPADIVRVPTTEIRADPARFQFKALGTEGVSGELKGVTRFNERLGGVITAWRDPADGELYVVNGHHRLELAQRVGHPSLNVQVIDAPDAVAARAEGAFMNIAEGRGTATDVAKFLRDLRATPADLESRGVSLRGDLARDGMSLSRLAPDVFDQVATGKVPQTWGVAIGSLIEDPTLQREAIAAARSSGQRLSGAEVRELARQVRDAGAAEATQETLFGTETERRGAYVARAQLASAIKKRLAGDRRLFGFVSQEGRAEELTRAGKTQIDVGAARGIADQSARAEELFDRLYTRSGPIAEVINAGAKRIAAGEKAGTVAAELYPAVGEAVGREIASGTGEAPRPNVGEPAGAGTTGAPEAEGAPPAFVDQNQEPLFVASSGGGRPRPIRSAPAEPGLFGSEQLDPAVADELARSVRFYEGALPKEKGEGLRATVGNIRQTVERFRARGVSPDDYRLRRLEDLADKTGIRVDDITAKRMGMPPDLQEGINLLGDEADWRRAVTTPGAEVLIGDETRGRIVRGAEDPVNGTGQRGMALVEHEMESQKVQRWYPATRLTPAAERPALELRGEPEGPAQGSMFGEAAGRESTRSLSQTEAAARGEIPVLRERLTRETDPAKRAQIAARLSTLEKLVNRGQAISAEELQHRAAAGEPAPFRVSAGGGGPRAIAERAAQRGSEQPTAPAPPVEKAAAKVGTLGDAVRRLFAPASRTPEAFRAAGIVRERAAELAQRNEQAREALRGFAKSFEKMPEQQRFDFIDRMESGTKQPTAPLEQAAKLLRQLLDGRREEIRALGTGKLEHFIENYFPHIWENPEEAQTVFAKLFGRRPLEGPRSFLRERSIPTTRDGLDAGLRPITTNPADLALLKLREMDRYLMGQRVLADLKEGGLLQFVHAFQRAPAGHLQINDRVSTVYGPPEVTVKEGFDQLVHDRLRDVVTSLEPGLSHERKTAIGGRRMGYAESTGRRMVTRFGGPESVIMHELGHILDFRYKLWDRLTDIPGKTRAAIRARKEMHQELRDLADLRHEGTPPEEVPSSEHRYVRNRYEKIANAIMALLYAPDKMGRVAPTVKARLTEFLRSDPKLKPLLDIEPSLVLGTNTAAQDVGGLVVLGHYYAPEPVATVVNNYLSPGLSANPLFGAYRGVGNVLNQAQLGLSAFHLAFTSMDASVSKAALGLEQLASGHPLSALRSAAEVPLAPITNFLRGNRVLKEYLRPGTQGSEFAQMVDGVIAAGGRIRMDTFYKNSSVERFWDAIHKSQYGTAARRTPGAILEAASKPIMEYLVPRQKLGVFADLARFELERLPEGATRDDVRAAMGRAWDSVDNRMGQLVYDNLFWQKSLKDLGMASVRSLGWNLGTFRELGGGSIDLLRTPLRAVKGGPILTHRAAYVVALPFTVGLAGAMVNYLFTGQGPRELKDYFFPRTGRQNPDGTDERLQIASYMRDVFAYGRAPYQTLKHKLNPVLATLSDMLENEDFYGNAIRNPDDPAVRQLQQIVDYAAKQFVPFGVRQYTQERQRTQSQSAAALSFFGVTPAPRAVTRTPAQNRLQELLRRHRGGGEMPEEVQGIRLRGDLLQGLREREPGIRDRILQAIRDRKITPGQAEDLVRRARITDPVSDFKQLSLKEALDVYRLANPEERRQWLPALVTKAHNAERAGNVEEARRFMDVIRDTQPAASAAGGQ